MTGDHGSVLAGYGHDGARHPVRPATVHGNMYVSTGRGRVYRAGRGVRAVGRFAGRLLRLVWRVIFAAVTFVALTVLVAAVTAAGLYALLLR